MGKALAKAGAVIAGAALIATGIGAAVGASLLGVGAAGVAGASVTLFGVSVGTLQAVGAGLSLAGSLLTKQPEIQTGGSPTQQTYDPQAGIPYVMGRTAVGGRIIYGTTTGPAKEPNRYRLHYSILSGAGPVQAIESYSANNQPVTFGADSGEGATGTYLNRMWQVRRLGAAGDSYLRFTATGSKDTPADHNGNPPEWTSAHLLGGYAAALTGMEYNTTVYAADVNPLWVLQGVKVYDPRLDSTYPGGAGSCRALNEATYVYSANPWLHALTFALGRFQNGQRVLGFGFPIASLILSQFVEAANVADANGWVVGGTIYSTDDKWAVMQSLAQTGGGYCLPMGAQVGCVVNAPRVSLDTVTSADILGEASAAGTKGRRDRINRIIPRFRSEAHGWEMVAASPIEVSTHVAEDGATRRTREVDYPLVQDVNQVAQLARYDIETSRELDPISVRVGPRFLGYRPGDCITLDVPEIGLIERDVVILRRAFDPASGTVTFSCRSETDAKHAFALGQTATAPPTPGLSTAGAVPVAPDTDDWVATGATLTDNGVSIPAIVIVGTMTDPHVTALLVRYRPIGDTDWRTGPSAQIASDEEARVELTGVTPETTYEVQIAFRSVRGVVSAWTVLDDVVAGSFAFATIGTSDGLLTVYYQATAPTAPERGDVWFDTDAGNAPFQWDGTAWISAANNAAVQAIQFATAAQATANTKILTFYQSSPPTASAIGDLWVDTDDASRRVFRWNGSAWLVIADQTGFNIAAGFTGQGELASLSVVNWATRVTGIGKPADYANRSLIYRATSAPYGSSITVNDIWIRTDSSGNGLDLWVYNGSSWISGADRTAYNTAMAIAGQGPWATASVPSGLTPTKVGDRTRYQGDDGQIFDYRGLYWGYSIDGVAGRYVSPLSSSVGGAACAAHTVYLYRQGYGSGYPISVSAHTVSGLANDTSYTWFYRPNYGDHFCVYSGYSPAFIASQDGYMLVGTIKTPTAADTYIPPASTTPVDRSVFDGNFERYMCVAAEAYLDSGQRAGEATAGDALTLMTPAGDQVIDGQIEALQLGEAQCLTLTTALGAVLTLSESTPLMTRKGAGFVPFAIKASTATPDLPVPVLTQAGDLVWDRVVHIAPAGRRTVAHVTVRGIGVFAASDLLAGPRLFTHNAYNKP